MSDKICILASQIYHHFFSPLFDLLENEISVNFAQYICPWISQLFKYQLAEYF